jgi:hypothetical protein
MGDRPLILLAGGAYADIGRPPRNLVLTEKLQFRYTTRTDGRFLTECREYGALVASFDHHGVATLFPGYMSDGPSVFSPLKQWLSTAARMPYFFIHDIGCQYSGHRQFREFVGDRAHFDRLLRDGCAESGDPLAFALYAAVRSHGVVSQAKLKPHQNVTTYLAA